MPKHRRKRRPPKRSLALPDLEQTKSAALNSLKSKSGQRIYDHLDVRFQNESLLGKQAPSGQRMHADMIVA